VSERIDHVEDARYYLAHVADSGDADVSPAEQQAWDGLGVRGIGTLRPDIAAALGLGVPGE